MGFLIFPIFTIYHFLEFCNFLNNYTESHKLGIWKYWKNAKTDKGKWLRPRKRVAHPKNPREGIYQQLQGHPQWTRWLERWGKEGEEPWGEFFVLGTGVLTFPFFVIYHFLEFQNSQNNSPESPIFEICKFCKNLEIGNILVLIKVN